MPERHGANRPRGLEFPPESVIHEGRFGRMFRNLPSFEPPIEELHDLADTMLEPPELDDNAPAQPAPPQPGYPAPVNGNGKPDFDNPDIPAGYTYLGQFIDHDITFDPVSSLQRQNDPDALHDFRTPRFDLDSLYGAGPSDAPYLYDQDADGAKLLIGANEDGELDLARNAQGRALIGDPRNDENIIVSQLQLLFLRFHNRVVDELISGNIGSAAVDLFEEGQRLVRWHYQWIVVHDFLRRVVGQDVVDDLLVDEPYVTSSGQVVHKRIELRFFGWHEEPFMPVEFSVAAYRFGHSMIRPDYRINAEIQSDIPIFVPAAHPGQFEDLRGFRPLPPKCTIDWSFFFEVGDASHLQHARLIDTKLAEPLRKLPGLEPAALARRNLERGVALRLPSGQRVAAAMCVPVLADEELGISSLSKVFVGRAPLWFYILKESELRANGRRLGAVGGRIVAEVLLGLLKGDPFSYINIEPCWRPTLPSSTADEFTMQDLIDFVNSPKP